MTTFLNRVVSLGGAAALVAAVGFSAGARAETTTQLPVTSACAAVGDFDPLCGHHYEISDIDPMCGHHYLG